MRVLGVLDLLAGRAVHARGGLRERYAPVDRFGGIPIEAGDALALARAYLERSGVRELYAADLDAIMRGSPQDALVSGLTRIGVSLWLDAGVTSARAAARAISLGVAVVVVGLETLPSFEVLGEICDTIGGERVAFSLDLRGGQPITDGIGAGDSALRLAERAASAGAAAIIVLDLARVGTGQGLDLVLIGEVRKAAPYVTLLAGGGVRGQEDLTLLEEIGCDGALVGTALISGDLKISHRRSGD